MPVTKNPFNIWWMTASPEQKADAAAVAGTTVQALRQIAHAWRTGGVPSTTAETAQAIEHACSAVGGPIVLRTDLCHACARCEYAEHAIKHRK